MAAQAGEAGHVYATLLLSDTYLPGALVVAHSLRDNGTTKKLAVLVTEDSVSAEVIAQLQAVFDHVIPVERIQNEHPNLHLMNRADLHSAFTKINLWKLTQFSKIVYLDADVVAYRAPDELFDIAGPFSAAPDIGWPDIFNTGVMVLTPNLGDYNAMMAMAERGVSFDGADQGLLNMYFKNGYNRISFAYNVTPSGHYQYIPAYKQFQSTINMVHFIGAQKPWFQGRTASSSDSPYDDMVRRWWAVYDKHYGEKEEKWTPIRKAPELVQYFVKGEYQPMVTQAPLTGEQPPMYPEPGFSELALYPRPAERNAEQRHPPPAEHDHGEHVCHHHHFPDHGQHEHHEHHDHHDHGHGQHHEHHPHLEHHAIGESHPHVAHPSDQHDGGIHHGTDTEPRAAESAPFGYVAVSSAGTQAEPREEQVHAARDEGPPSSRGPDVEKKEEHHQPPPMEPAWDAQWQPPPRDSKPEAMNFPQMRYEMSRDSKPFVPPETYPEPPKGMWYEVPKGPPPAPKEKPKPIFPWETHQPRPTRVFAAPPSEPEGTDEGAPSTYMMGEREPKPKPGSRPRPQPAAPVEYRAPAEPIRTGPTMTPRRETLVGPATPTTPTSPTTPTTPAITVTASDPWAAAAANVWDEMPGIHRYVERFVDHTGIGFRSRPGDESDQGVPPGALKKQGGFGRSFFKITDFPTADERPSLPVTPAPTGARFQFPIEGGVQVLPEAEGVPAQRDWVCSHGRRWGPSDCLCDLTNVLRYHKNPVERLAKLAQQQAEILSQKLSEEKGKKREIPQRQLPYGSQDVLQPAATVTSSAKVLSPRPVKAGVSNKVRSLAEGGRVVVTPEGQRPRPAGQSAAPWGSPRERGSRNHSRQGSAGSTSRLSAPPRQAYEEPRGQSARVSYETPAETSAARSHGFPGTTIPEPSYTGPGAGWEKDEGEILAHVRPALPSEEDKEMLDT